MITKECFMKKKILMLCVVGISSSALVAVEAPSKGVASEVSTKAPEKPVAQQSSVKKLTSVNMQLLDGFLLGYPLGVIRMDLAGKAALKVLQELSKPGVDEQTVVKEQMHYILTPIKQFFEVIHSYGSIIKPLVKDSLENDVQRKAAQLISAQQSTATLVKDNPENDAQGKVAQPASSQQPTLNNAQALDQAYRDSLLLGFLDATSTLDTFFETNVKDKETLAKTCREFIVFFRDLKASLSDATIAAYKKLAQELATKKP